MKELGIEEKAKRYDEALKQVKECTSDENGFITIYPQEIFPELKESKDGENKRVSKEITQFLKRNNGWNREWLAWLEKQGEQKSDWSEEDEKMVNDIIAAIDTLCYHGMFNWLKSLKQRIGG